MHIIGYDSTKKVKAIVTSHMCIHSVPANCISTSLMWLTNSRPWSVIITLAHPNLHNTFCYLPWRHVIISIIPAHCLVDELCYSICWLGWQSSCFWPFGKVINHCYNELITTSSNRKRTYQVYSYLQRNIVAHFNMLLHITCASCMASQITLWTTFYILHLIYIYLFPNFRRHRNGMQFYWGLHKHIIRSLAGITCSHIIFYVFSHAFPPVKPAADPVYGPIPSQVSTWQFLIRKPSYTLF